MKKRVDFIDYGKAIVIFLVVTIHVGIDQLNFLALLTMPLFFIIPGYLYNPDKHSPKTSIIKRFKSLILPYWRFMVLYAVVEVFRASILGYGDVSIALPSLISAIYGSTKLPVVGPLTNYLLGIMSYKPQVEGLVDLILPTNCHLWFLPALFTGFVMFVLIVQLAKKSGHELPVYLVGILAALLLSSVETIDGMFQLPYAIGRGGFACACLITGLLIRKSGLFESTSKPKLTVSVALSILVYAVIYLQGYDGGSIVRSVYGPNGVIGVFLTFIGGVAGAYALLQLLRGVEKCPVKWIKSVLSTVGQNTLTIYLWHFVLICVFDCLFFGITHLPIQPDQFYMALIPSNFVAYKVVECILIVAILTGWALIKPKLGLGKAKRPTDKPLTS